MPIYYIDQSIHLSIYPSIHLSIYPSYLSIYLADSPTNPIYTCNHIYEIFIHAHLISNITVLLECQRQTAARPRRILPQIQWVRLLSCHLQSMHVYIYVCMYIYMCVCVCVYVRKYGCMGVCMCVFICVRMYVCVCACMYILCVCVYVYTYV